MSIHVNNISKSFGDQQALENISFEIGRGEIVGFLGPNGAGKSTLMKILTGYLSADSGKARINDFELDTQLEDLQRSIGYLPEHNPLYTEMYVREYLQFHASIFSASKDRIEEVIKLTGLSPEANKKIEQLSKDTGNVWVLRLRFCMILRY